MGSHFSPSSLADHRDLLPSWYHPNARLERINQTATSANIWPIRGFFKPQRLRYSFTQL